MPQRSLKPDGSQPDWQVHPIELVCPCGKPLEIGQLQDGRWVLGHIDIPLSRYNAHYQACSPLIVHANPQLVLEHYITLTGRKLFSAPGASPQGKAG